MKAPFLAVCLVLVLARFAPAQDSLNVRYVGSWPFGLSQAVAVDSTRKLAFVGSGDGVYVLDVNDPAVPVKLSEIGTRRRVRDLCYADNRLYVANDTTGLRII